MFQYCYVLNDGGTIFNCCYVDDGAAVGVSRHVDVAEFCLKRRKNLAYDEVMMNRKLGKIKNPDVYLLLCPQEVALTYRLLVRYQPVRPANPNRQTPFVLGNIDS
jgi:hypothetical protein